MLSVVRWLAVWTKAMITDVVVLYRSKLGTLSHLFHCFLHISSAISLLATCQTFDSHLLALYL